MNVTLFKALVALVPGWMLLTGSIAQFTRERTKHTLLQVLGAGALVVVIFAHAFEALRFLPWMGWGRQSTAGHYIDVGSAVVAATLFPTGYLLHALKTRRAGYPTLSQESGEGPHGLRSSNSSIKQSARASTCASG